MENVLPVPIIMLYDDCERDNLIMLVLLLLCLCVVMRLCCWWWCWGKNRDLLDRDLMLYIVVIIIIHSRNTTFANINSYKQCRTNYSAVGYGTEPPEMWQMIVLMRLIKMMCQKNNLWIIFGWDVPAFAGYYVRWSPAGMKSGEKRMSIGAGGNKILLLLKLDLFCSHYCFSVQRRIFSFFVAFTCTHYLYTAVYWVLTFCLILCICAKCFTRSNDNKKVKT